VYPIKNATQDFVPINLIKILLGSTIKDGKLTSLMLVSKAEALIFTFAVRKENGFSN
jgi:hypothetical protein